MSDFDSDVLIVGAGPTGLMLAAELALAGITPTVIEQRAEPMPDSRALGFSARTIEEFDQRGLLSQFGEVSTIPVGHFGGLELDYRVLDGGSYGARGIPQSRTEAILGKWACELGVRVRRGVRLVGLTPRADHVEVEVEVETAEGRQAARPRWVVGCDGARSAVRQLAGIDFPGTEPTLEMWLADVAGCPLRPRFSGERVPGGMVMVLPMGPEVNRVVVHERAAEVPARREQLDFGQVADCWERLTGEDIHGGRPLWVSWFTDSSRQASAYRQGRVLLAGDAAHVHLPIGGQGMSAGVQDAVNLGWKLAAHVRGTAPAELLNTYHDERHPVGARVLTNTLAQRTLYLNGDEFDPLREVLGELMTYQPVREHLVGMVTGLDIRYPVGPGEHPLLGVRVPEAELVTSTGAGGKTSVFAQLHAGRALLLDLADDPALRAEAASWADRLTVCTAAAHAASDLAALHEVCALLVRPDGYVAWIHPHDAPAEERLAAALTRWLGQPD